MSQLVIETNSKKHNAFLLAITMILLCVGFYLSSINYMEHEWFSRAGSLVVICGIGSGFTGIIHERVLLGQLEIKRRIEITRAKRKLRKIKADITYIAKELSDIEDAFEQHATTLTQAIKLSFGMIEGVLLILGTLIWGFGDLVWLFFDVTSSVS